MITKFDAFISLCPDCGFGINQDGSVDWYERNTKPIPSDVEITNEIARLEAIQQSTKYQRSRSAEYPPITDYLDGVVKGDQAQIDKYIADCQAVKAKYPKGS